MGYSMSKGRIFLVRKDADGPIPLEESGYIAESELQHFLAAFPDLLPGDQINPDEPLRWLLVAREMGVPGDMGETGRWSLDHLFLDQDGIPTFVECKRAGDTRSRREVVAQMLDYAANALEYWDIDRIRLAAAETAEKSKKSLDDEIIELVDAEDLDTGVIEAYWTSVEHNLQVRQVRLIFISDFIPKELRRLVEFLNEQMVSVEVVAVEVKQYRGLEDAESRALVPRVIGATEAAHMKKRSSKTRRKTDLAEFLYKCPPEVRGFFTDVVDLTKDRGYSIYWGTAGFSVRAKLAKKGRLASFIQCYPPGKFQFYFHASAQINREKDSPLRKELMEYGVFEESGDYTLTALVDAENSEKLLTVYIQILKKIEAIEAGLIE
jgi:hypothetical protein